MTTNPNPPAIAPGAADGRLLFGRHPSLWLGTLSAVLMLGTAAGIPGLSGVQAAAINLAVATVLGAVWAWHVRPIAPAVYTQAVGALAGLGAAYGLHVSAEIVGAAQFVVVQVLALIAWGQVSPASARTAVTPPAPPPAVALSLSDVVQRPAEYSRGRAGQPPAEQPGAHRRFERGVAGGQQLAPGAAVPPLSTSRPTIPPPDAGRPGDVPNPPRTY